MEKIKFEEELINLGFEKDVENGFIWNNEKNNYIRVYIDKYYDSDELFIVNVRGSKFTRDYKPFKEFDKALTFIMKLQKRLN